MYYIVTRRRPFDDLESKEAAHQMSFCGLRPSLSQGDLRWGAWKRDKSDMEDPLKSISFAISQGWAGEVEERHDARTMLRMVSDLYSEEAAVSIHCERGMPMCRCKASDTVRASFHLFCELVASWVKFFALLCISSSPGPVCGADISAMHDRDA